MFLCRTTSGLTGSNTFIKFATWLNLDSDQPIISLLARRCQCLTIKYLLDVGQRVHCKPRQ